MQIDAMQAAVACFHVPMPSETSDATSDSPPYSAGAGSPWVVLIFHALALSSGELVEPESIEAAGALLTR